METKNNKGFSLIEILVAMTLIGVLSAMAIPAYNSYRKDANKTVLKADVGNAYKAIHTYNAVNSTYCAKLDDLKLGSLKNSDTYKKGNRKSFVGFASETCTANIAATDLKKENNGGVGLNTSACVLDEITFKFAVANEFGGEEVGYSVTNDSNSPKAGGAFCHATGDTTVIHSCSTSAACTTAGTCNNNTAATWKTAGGLCN